MKITLIQTELVWEDKQANLLHFTKLIDSIQEDTDVIVLPEMFSTGFTMHASELSESMDGTAVNWIKQTARKMNAAICGSLIIREEEKFYNRFIWMSPEGTVYTYNKRHLFRMGEEHHYYEQGTERVIIEHKGFRIFPVVCYDLRFPVWLRRTPSFDYDMLLVMANWPQRRQLAWKTLLQARAIENQCYVIGVNRTGTDGNNIYHAGGSSIIDPKGEVIFCKEDEPATFTYAPDAALLTQWRHSFPAIEDADSFQLE